MDVLLTFCKPDTKIAVVYCSAEPNSIYQAERAERYLKRLKRDCAIYTVADSNDVQAVLTKVVQECGCYLHPDRQHHGEQHGNRKKYHDSGRCA